ncbi:hypothetical protein HPB48_015711 [Haemaphysalis longicornis]|uniref:Uncharacterized protein n=1 Tax=Haemaphysalis longicornis TaxID=44386 RepID=A0A9J6FAM9_HAELO|nr:hypothetical protein HPB48_015711 [Haemaphysalis longicornis]
MNAASSIDDGSSVCEALDEAPGIRDVWAFNLDEELHNIDRIIKRYNYVAIDTEFPGDVELPNRLSQPRGIRIPQPPLQCEHDEGHTDRFHLHGRSRQQAPEQLHLAVHFVGILIGATPNYASTLARDPLSQRGEDSPSRPLPARGYGRTNARRSVGHVGRDVVAPPKGSRRRARASGGPRRDWLGADSDRYFVTASSLTICLDLELAINELEQKDAETQQAEHM